MPSHRTPIRSALVALALALPAAALGADAPPLRDVIDAQVQAAWKRHKITPAQPSGDAEFLRRVYLDLTGSVPTYEETLAFLDGKGDDRRAKLIDHLLADPRFARNQADVWDMTLFGRNPPGYDSRKRDGFQAWLRSRFEKNVAYDVWVRDLLRAEGTSADGPTHYYVQYGNAPLDAIEAVTQTFLGVQLQCARCHDHPYEEWKQLDFYGMAAFLARLQVVTVGRKGQDAIYAIGEHDSGDVQFTGPAKDAGPGKKGEPVKPKFLAGVALAEPAADVKAGRPPRFKDNQPPPKPKFSRKDQLAEWVTAPTNPYFARAVTNRVWAQYMGRGLIHPVDNMSPANAANMPDLLAVLTKEMAAHRYDLKWFIKELVNSKTYQLSGAGGGEPMPTWYQHARSRPLSAEELVEAWRLVTGYDAVERAGKKAGTSRHRPLDGYLVQFFGSPNTGTGDFQGGLAEHLYLNNGPLAQMITAGKGSLAEVVGDAKKPVGERVERLFVQALHRRPTAAERDKFAAYLDKNGSAADAVWALITCGEFRFNH